jgi:hypothetical protein
MERYDYGLYKRWAGAHYASTWYFMVLYQADVAPALLLLLLLQIRTQPHLGCCLSRQAEYPCHQPSQVCKADLSQAKRD